MTATTWLDLIAPLLTVLTPLVGVPLALITFYLRSLREHQVSWHADQVHRLDTVEAATRDLRTTIREFERDFTTKEEWLRECMQARRALSRLTRTTARLEARESMLLNRDRDQAHGRVDCPGEDDH